ncbi:MAG: 4-hydroxy-3-methylbut-2-enyl diphosphate reductase [bacterium]
MSPAKRTSRARRVRVARPTGFCFGVERAIRLAREGKRKHGRIATLGELVHNPQVLRELAAEGIRSVRSPREAREGALVVRAHGCPPEVFERCAGRGLTVIDATCPYVRKVQSVARRLMEGGYRVVVVGERDHPEVRSILGYCRGAGMVYAPGRRVRGGRVGVVAQTTMSRERLRLAVANLSNSRYTELRVFDTICEEVTARQDAAARIAADSDLVVVVGGRSSANTSRLAEIAAEAGAEILHVESAAELSRGKLSGFVRIGVIAGSSTPAWVVREVARSARNPF